jgi:methyltransferase (TIGR00027 family)
MSGLWPIAASTQSSFELQRSYVHECDERSSTKRSNELSKLALGVLAMDEERPSVTAEGAAVMRTIHQTLDDKPRILDDPISPRLIDTQTDFYKSRLELLERLPELTRMRLKATFVMRSRYAEDCLAEDFHNGVRQYVLLGAGLDTFAYRQPSWAKSLQIFEVDHPATQRWKRRQLADANIPMPGNVALVPVDFEKISLATALAQAGADLRGTTFFSMLGVTQYLTEIAFDQTLRFVLSMPSGSEFVLSFVASDAVLPPDDVALVKAFAAQFGAIGEPWLLRFLPRQLVTKLSDMGFSRVFHLTAEEATERYFQNRSDGLTASILEQMIRATV